METDTDTEKIIEALGGTGAVAKLCEVTDGAVSQWRYNGIPRARLMFLRVIRPDVFCKPKPHAEAEHAEHAPT